MNYIDIENKIKNIISLQMNKDVKEIYLELSLEELGVDSLDLLEIIFLIEDEFKIKIEENEFKNSTTVKDLLYTVCYKLNGDLKINNSLDYTDEMSANNSKTKTLCAKCSKSTKSDYLERMLGVICGECIEDHLSREIIKINTKISKLEYDKQNIKNEIKRIKQLDCKHERAFNTNSGIFDRYTKKGLEQL